MQPLPELANTILVAFVGILVVYATRVQLRMRQDLSEMRADIRDLRQQMNEEFRQVRAEIASLRSDLTQVALAVGTHMRPQTG